MWMPFLLLAFATAVSSSLKVQNAQSERLITQSYRDRYTIAVNDVGSAVERFLLSTARYPNDLNELISAQPDLAPYAGLVDYSVVSQQDASGDRYYQKAIVFIKSDQTIPNATWLAQSSCDGQSFSDNGHFCKRDGSVFAVSDSRTYQHYLASETIVRLDYLSQQVFNGRTIKGAFPKELSSGAEIADGNVVTLASAVGYSGTPESCTGLFNFDGAVLSCEFLFSLTGTPVYYIRESDSSVVLYVDLPIQRIDGEPHRIARPLRVL